MIEYVITTYIIGFLLGCFFLAQDQCKTKEEQRPDVFVIFILFAPLSLPIVVTSVFFYFIIKYFNRNEHPPNNPQR